MIKAILWDNDGVLVDTEGLYFRATRDALRGAGVELSRETFVEYSLQHGRSCFDLLPSREWPAQRVAELRADRDRAYLAMLANGIAPMAGIREVLARLRGRFRMAVVTTSRRDHFNAMHRRSGLAEFFEFALTREDYQRSKPDPQPYLTALKRLDLAARESIAIEDSERGLASAAAAGLRCIVIPGVLTRGGAFANALAVLESTSELPDVLARLQDKR